MNTALHSLVIALVLGTTGCSTAIADTATTSGGSDTPKVTTLARPAYQACMKGAKSRVEQAPCMANEQAFQDAQLDKAYERLSQTMTAEQRNALTQSQNAWQAFKQADTRLGVSLLDPAGLDLSVSDNTILLTIQRRQMIEHLIDLIR